ncbi:hypothetical protein [Scale drop disease virus]|uniref:ORF_065R n=1 Tax=Scale drop disease virus TaxID=1697349 RepID=A0A0K1L768_9VIRU|nr:ORF_065R [Scale drop disease virus]AKU37480.1 ORF_065R [Scale drop disease virus]QLI60737.1 hypothetical protein [Scale drop disease virus]QXJ13655.1 ORF065R [Scale drop disease virus]UNH60718.1 hypothetical protein SDDV_ORF049 [Scale drop disease virus]
MVINVSIDIQKLIIQDLLSIVEKVTAIMQSFVALKSQGNYSFVGRCKYKQHQSAIAKFSCETSLAARHEYMTSAALTKYQWFPNCLGFHEDMADFQHPMYTHQGPKEVCFFEDIGSTSMSMYSFLKHRSNRKHIMDSIVVQTTGAICSMYINKIVHNDMHTNNILIRKCDHDVVVYTHSNDPYILSCTPTYGVEPVIIDMGMAKHVQNKNNKCYVSEYHTHLGMSISGDDVDVRFDPLTMLLNTIPVYKNRKVSTKQLDQFVKDVLHDVETGRPCDDSFRSLHNVVFNTIPGKLVTTENEMLLLDAAFLARATVPLRRYQESINLHFLWKEFYALFFHNNEDPLLKLKNIVKHFFRTCGKVWNRESCVVQQMGKAIASLTIRVNSQNNRAKKRLYKNVDWSNPTEMLVLLASNKNMQTKTAEKLASLSNSARVMIYEIDTGKTCWTAMRNVRAHLDDYVKMISKINMQDVTSCAVLLKMMYRSEYARQMVDNVLYRRFQTQHHINRRLAYEHLIIVCIYTVIVMYHMWRIALYHL